MENNLKRLTLDIPADIRDVDDNFQLIALDMARQAAEIAWIRNIMVSNKLGGTSYLGASYSGETYLG